MRRSLLIAVLAALLVTPMAQAWSWPADGAVLQQFDFDRAHPYSGGQHRGIDLAGDVGAAVPAPAAGTVTFSGSVPGSGRSVTIATADGYAVTLTHLGAIAVAKMRRSPRATLSARSARATARSRSRMCISASGSSPIRTAISIRCRSCPRGHRRRRLLRRWPIPLRRRRSPSPHLRPLPFRRLPSLPTRCRQQRSSLPSRRLRRRALAQLLRRRLRRRRPSRRSTPLLPQAV